MLLFFYRWHCSFAASLYSPSGLTLSFMLPCHAAQRQHSDSPFYPLSVSVSPAFFFSLTSTLPKAAPLSFFIQFLFSPPYCPRCPRAALLLSHAGSASLVQSCPLSSFRDSPLSITSARPFVGFFFSRPLCRCKPAGPPASHGSLHLPVFPLTISRLQAFLVSPLIFCYATKHES
ncbi:hypothetical protein ACFX15_042976 [Malus domestica]